MTMLDTMRRHRGWLKWLLGLIVLAFIFFYVPDFVRGTDARRRQRGGGGGGGRADHRAASTSGS